MASWPRTPSSASTAWSWPARPPVQIRRLRGRGPDLRTGRYRRGTHCSIRHLPTQPTPGGRRPALLGAAEDPTSRSGRTSRRGDSERRPAGRRAFGPYAFQHHAQTLRLGACGRGVHLPGVSQAATVASVGGVRRRNRPLHTLMRTPSDHRAEIFGQRTVEERSPGCRIPAPPVVDPPHDPTVIVDRRRSILTIASILTQSIANRPRGLLRGTSVSLRPAHPFRMATRILRTQTALNNDDPEIAAKGFSDAIQSGRHQRLEHPFRQEVGSRRVDEEIIFPRQVLDQAGAFFQLAAVEGEHAVAAG